MENSNITPVDTPATGPSQGRQSHDEEKPVFWSATDGDFNEYEENMNLHRLARKVVILDPEMDKDVQTRINNGSIKKAIDQALQQKKLLRHKSLEER